MNYPPVEARKPSPLSLSWREVVWLAGGLLVIWLFLVFVGGIPMEKVTLGMAQLSVSAVVWTLIFNAFPRSRTFFNYGLAAVLLFGPLSKPGGWRVTAILALICFSMWWGNKQKFQVRSWQALLILACTIIFPVVLLSGVVQGAVVGREAVFAICLGVGLLLLMALFDALKKRAVSKLSRLVCIGVFLFAASVCWFAVIGGAVYISELVGVPSINDQRAKVKIANPNCCGTF